MQLLDIKWKNTQGVHRCIKYISLIVKMQLCDQCIGKFEASIEVSNCRVYFDVNVKIKELINKEYRNFHRGLRN